MSHSPSLAVPAFPGDDGAVDPGLAVALDEYARHPVLPPVLAALHGVRLLIPVIALLLDIPADGDKDSEMAAVLMTGADGRKALLAFSSLESMRRWDPQARPVSVYAKQAAEAAMDDEASALLLDIAGPQFIAIETEDLRHLAQGHRIAETRVAAGPDCCQDGDSARYAWLQ